MSGDNLPAKADTPERIDFLNEPLQITTDFGTALARFIEGIQQVGRKLLEGFATLYVHVKKAELIEESGWLPHSTTPFTSIELGTDPATVSAMIDAHYRQKWHMVRSQLLSRIDSYEIDDEAKATYREAIAAHENGHYRSVVRLLFPEIERVATVEMYDRDFLSIKSDPEKNRDKTSLMGLRKALSHSLGVMDIGGIEYAFALFNRLMGHFYNFVGSDAERIAKYQADPVPNRHASLHGIVIYNTYQNSINMLILADFMFHLINQGKKLMVEANKTDETTS